MSLFKKPRVNRFVAGIVSFAMAVTSFGMMPITVFADTTEQPTVTIQIPDLMDGETAKGDVSYSIKRGEAREVFNTPIDVADYVASEPDQIGTVRYTFTLPDVMENDFTLQTGDLIEIAFTPASGWVFDTHRGVNVNNGQTFTVDNNMIAMTVLDGNNCIEFGFEQGQPGGQPGPGPDERPPFDPNSSLSWNTLDQSEDRIADVEVLCDGEWTSFVGLTLTEGQEVTIRFKMADAPDGQEYVIDEAGFEYFHREDDRIRVEHNVGQINPGDIEAALMSEEGYTFTFAPAANTANAGGESSLNDQNSYLRLQFSTRINYANKISLKMFVQYTDSDVIGAFDNNGEFIPNGFMGEEIEFSVNGNRYGYTGRPSDLGYLITNEDTNLSVTQPSSEEKSATPSSFMFFDEVGVGGDNNIIEFFNENYEEIYVVGVGSAADDSSFDFTSADCCTSSDGHFEINIGEATTDFAILIRRHEDPQGNIGWRYTSTDPENDDEYVDYGHVIVENVVRDGEVILSDIVTDEDGNIVVDEFGRPTYEVDFLNTEEVAGSWDTTNAGGEFRLYKGDIVTFRLIPYYGYQISSANLNGSVLTPNDDVSSFTFTVTGNLHLAGAFVEAEDEILTDGATNVSAATIVDGQNATDTGNLRLTVEDNTSYANADSAIEAAIGEDNCEGEIIATLDLTLEGIVSQGIEDQYWETPITEFEDPISVVLSVDNIELEEGQTIKVVREHDDALEVIDAEYDEEDGSLVILTDRFSTYTIIVLSEISEDDKDPTPEVTPSTTPSVTPSVTPSATPTKTPTAAPTTNPKPSPSVAPTVKPTVVPTATVTPVPSTTTAPKPTAIPTVKPTVTVVPTTAPTVEVTTVPTEKPTQEPTVAPTTEPTAEPTEKPTATPTVEEKADVSSFAERLYTTCLDRDSEEAGKDYWTSELKSGKSGAEVAEGFFFSPEIEQQNLTDKEFITRLYETFMGREPDEDGMNYWLSVLKDGNDRKFVFDGFVNSTEWADICLDYGIRSGGTGKPTHEKEASEEVKNFAERLYTTCLGRESEAEGLKYWSQELANLRNSGTEAARGFFFSPEFINLNLSNEEYVTRLYKTFMGRDPEAAGFEFWVGQLKAGASREDVFNGFSAAPEFGDICAEAGIFR